MKDILSIQPFDDISIYKANEYLELIKKIYEDKLMNDNDYTFNK